MPARAAAGNRVPHLQVWGDFLDRHPPWQRHRVCADEYWRQLAAAGARAEVLDLPVQAQNRPYPSEPIRLIVPFATGGTADVVGRLFAQYLSTELGSPVVVENKAGAGGSIGARIVADARPDGYTLLLASSSTHAANPAVYRKLPYDAVTDFTPISQLITVPGVLSVGAKVPETTLAALIERSRQEPDRYTYASSGTGGLGNLAMELLKRLSGARILHVPYKGAGPAFNDVIGGQVTMIWEPLPASLPFIKSGQLRALAVASRERVEEIPAVPTFAEAGIKDYDVSAWNGLLGPRGLPAGVTARLAEATTRTLANPDLQARLKALGGTVVGNTPEQFAAIIRDEVAKWKQVTASAGIALD